MNHTKIEWCDYTWNPITGCNKGCFYCYAKKISDRFGKSFTPEFHPERIFQPEKEKKPSRIFTGSMGDFWDKDVKQIWRDEVYKTIKNCPHHQFLILTKQADRIADDYDRIPPNVWLGQTITRGWGSVYLPLLSRICFISAEPLLGHIEDSLREYDWLIIGAMSGPGADWHKPEKEWIADLVAKANNFNIPVFMKNNLKPYWDGDFRQEFPREDTK